MEAGPPSRSFIPTTGLKGPRIIVLGNPEGRLVRHASERRQSRRYPIQLPLLHTAKAPTDAGSGVGWTHHLSEGGADVELTMRLPAHLPLGIRLRTDRGPIEAEAAVVWTKECFLPGGGILHGIAFARLSLQQLQALRGLLISTGLFRPAGVRLPFELAVTCQLKGQPGPPFPAHTRDMSRGGALLRLPQLVPAGTAMDLTLHTRTQPLTAEGTIIWVAPPEGRTPGEPILHGLRFAPLGWTSLLALGLVLAES